MKCYFHQHIDAVSTCKECGKNMCKACYDEGKKGLCVECAAEDQEMRRQEYIDENEKSKSYTRMAIVFFIFGAIMGLSNMQHAESPLEAIFFFLLPAYGFFSLHAGLNILKSMFKSVLSWGVVLIFGWPVLLLLAAFAVVLGAYFSIPMFISKRKEYINGKQHIYKKI